MSKKLRIAIVCVVVLGIFLVVNNSPTKKEKAVAKHMEFIKTHPYSKSIQLSKKERISQALPPNKYFEQMELWQMNPTTGRTHREHIFKVQRDLKNQRLTNRAPGDAQDNPWVERGPTNVGGRTRVVIFDPNDATHKRVFAGGVSGGLWVNNDITRPSSSWVQIDFPENVAVTCMTVDPNNSQIMYIGTGESYTSDNAVGNGVWKSTNGGTTWTNVFNDAANANDDLKLLYINAIQAWNNPGTNQTEVFIGVAGAYFRRSQQFLGSQRTGLYKTINDGASWTKLTLNTPQGSPYEPNDFEIGADNTLWMSSERNIYGHGGGTIFKSTDGSSFTVAHTITEGNRTEIAVSATDKDKVFVLARGGLTALGDEAPISMLKTTDGFGSTTNMTLPTPVDVTIPGNDFTRGQSFYDLVIEVDPSNDDILYVGGIDIYRSTNAGDAWAQLSKWSNNNQMSNLPRPLVHADQHAFTFHPTDSNIALIGNDGGVYYATSITDAATSTVTPNTFISERNTDYNVTQFYHGAIGQNPANETLLAGAQDNGTPFVEGATPGANQTIDVFGGDGAYSFIDKDGEYMIVSYVYNYKARYNLPYNGSGIILDEDQGSGSFINPQGLDDNLDVLYSNGSTSSYDSIVRYRGIKSGETLVKDKIGNTLLNNTTTALAVSPFTTSSSTLFVGLLNGRILKITNAETATPTFTDITNNLLPFPDSGTISSIAFGTSENELMVTFFNFGIQSIWYTSNGGATWVSKEGDFPDIPVRDIMMNPLRTQEVIIATELGVWRTDNFNDASPNWVQSNNGMSNVAVTSLELRKVDHTIIATTYGRGMFTGQFTAFGASVDEVLSDAKAFTVYPTINNGSFTVFAKNDLGKSKVILHDITGKKAHETTVDFSTESRQQVSVNAKPGVYIITLIDENNRRSNAKLIIE